MKLLLYELKKLIGQKYLIVLLAVVTVACSGFYYYLYGIEERDKDLDRDLDRAIEQFFDEYKRSPERIDALRAEHEAYKRARDDFFKSMSIDDPTFDELGWEEKQALLAENGIVYENRLGYKDDDGVTIDDELFFEQMRISEERPNSYTYDDVLNTVRGTMLRYEAAGAVDSPVYEYESHIYKRYSSLRDNLKIEPYVHVHDWDTFFGYNEFSIFVCVYLILAGGVVFLNERSCGFMPVIRTTRGGRAKTSAAKLGAVALMAVIVVIVLTVGVLITAEAAFGLSSPSAPIQLVSGRHSDCAYNLSIGGYVVLLTAVRCVTAAAFSCAIAFVSALSFSPVLTYAFGVIAVAANVIVNFRATSSDVLLINLVSMLSDEPVYYYSELLIFGHYWNTLAVGVVLYVLIAIAAGAGVIVVGSRRGFLPTPRSAKRLFALFDRTRAKFETNAENVRSKKKKRTYPVSIFRWEVGKLLPPGIVVSVAVLIAASGVEAYYTYHERVPKSRINEESYINEHLFGCSPEEARAYIDERRAYINKITSDDTRSNMLIQCINGWISEEEYEHYFIEAEDAKDEGELLNEILTRVDYLEQLKDETGVVGTLIPESNVTRLLGRDINVFMLAAVLIVFCRAYAADFAVKSSEGSFANIMRATRRGRRASWRGKFAAAAVVALLIAAAFAAVELVVGIFAVGRFFEVTSVPLMSLESYRAVDGPITVGAYLAFEIALRCAAVVLLALLTVSASFAVKKVPPTLFLTAAFTLVPYLLVYMGVLALRYIDFTAMLAGGKLLSRSVTFALFGSKYAFALILPCGYAVLTLFSMLAVRKKTGK